MTAAVGTEVAAVLRSLAERYARGVDRRDTVLFLSAFHPNATLAVYLDSAAAAPDRVLTGHDRLARVIEAIAGYARTFHMLGQCSYVGVGAGEATGEVYCMAHHLSPASHGGTDYVMCLRYDDRYTRGADGEWRIAHRRVLVDLTETHAAEAGGRRPRETR